jgi:hypothetical protein
MEPIGMYWSVSEIEEATKGIQFPAGVNKWDLFVGINAMRNDLSEDTPDAEVIKHAISFYFRDKDWKTTDGNYDKVWRYMACAYAGK